MQIPSIWIASYSNKETFENDWETCKDILTTISQINNSIEKTLRNNEMTAYCEVCGMITIMRIVTRFGIKSTESGVCEICGLSDRTRAVFDFLRYMTNANMQKAKIYVTEAVTPFFSELASLYKNVSGSEYLTYNSKNNVISGKYYDYKNKSVMHQDLTELSFSDNTFDYVISQHVLEHIPNYKKALYECYRVLSLGGMFIFTIPFDCFYEYETVIIANVDETGEIVHKGNPEIHGNPVGEGSVCYQHFGWDIINDLQECGFSQVRANLYYSPLKGHYSDFDPKFVFSAVK